MNGVNNFNTYIGFPQSVTPYISALHSKVSTLGINVLVNLGIYLCMGLAVAVQFYQGYQCKQHNPFQLDDRLKFVKCAVILKEAKDLKKKDSAAIVVSLLEKCQTLLLSIKSDIRGEKEDLICQLAVQFAESNPEKSYALTDQLFSHRYLSDVIKRLCKQDLDFDQTQLTTLLQKTLDAYSDYMHKRKTVKPPPEDLLFYLDIAKTFNDLNKPQLRDISLNAAGQFIKNFEAEKTLLNLNDFNTYGRIAKCFYEMGKEEDALARLNYLKSLLNHPTLPQEELARAHLILARAYLDCEQSVKMWKELKDPSLLNFLQNSNVPFTIDECNTLETLRRLMTFEGKLISEFEDFAQTLVNRLNITWTSVANSESIGPLLNIAYTYDTLNCKTEARLAMNRAWDTAWKKIQTSPTQSITEKDLLTISMIIHYFRGAEDFERMERILDQIQPMLGQLEELYVQSSDDQSNEIHLLNFYKEMNLTEKSNLFFDKKIAKSENSKKPFEAITKWSYLVILKLLSLEQKKKCLEAAERLLPNLTESVEYDLATQLIAKAYVEVDTQKSIQLIEHYQNSKGTQHYIGATVTAAVMVGTLYVNATASLGLVILGIFAKSVYGIGK
jgi:hypothetical protein